MSVTAPLGFTAAGLTAGLKPSGTKDLSLVINSGPSDAVAAVFTSNRCKANPVLWSQKASANGQARAVVLNSGGANCYTGDFGYETTTLTAQTTADALTAAGTDTKPEDILVCSTGLIGVGGQGFRDSVLSHLPPLVAATDTTVEAGQDAAEAIMTTDTVAKTASRTGSTGFTIGGMAKGAGMLAPGLATMLVVITTDAKLDQSVLDDALRAATNQSFDRLDTDGCMSTNDTVILMSSGAHDAAVDAQEFTSLLREVCLDLMHQLHVDAEGAHHDIAITTTGAASEADAVEVSRSVSRSALFKAAIFGEDPNWGRVVAQVGTTSADFDPTAIDVTINGVQVCKASGPYEDPERVTFERSVDVVIDLHAGDHDATVWTSDLTHDYVEENSAYSS
ncbi:bifunctional glutamate N-acetyltransferase/amino-acid acetyltransferase ArgJ [Brevibacterium renqingii]|uniref:bifunctional glutamate N-acetyltransferase/amino-acid acetyltransferase ArgJ n=1 Tax=Brevibacterium renqingii TaxID=2776916 RepID=UPI001ADF30D5|nr:bifunctional glutamate N-acetyltransferase/amino-acid acetyltransferase ArgJ [Brevibacterium renqingii]